MASSKTMSESMWDEVAVVLLSVGRRHIDQAHDARAHNPGHNSDSASSSSSGEEQDAEDSEEYEKNVRDGRSVREKRYEYDPYEAVNEASGDEEGDNVEEDAPYLEYDSDE